MNQTITLAPGDTITIVGGQAGSTTTPNPQPVPTPTPQPVPGQAPAGVNIIDLPWDSHGQRTYTRDHGGFPAGGSVAFKFRTGPNNTDSRGAVPFTTSFQGGGIQGARTVVISETPGDFDNIVRNNMAEARSGNADGSMIVCRVGEIQLGIPTLQPDHDYYMNVRYNDGEHLGDIEAYIAKPGYLA